MQRSSGAVQHPFRGGVSIVLPLPEAALVADASKSSDLTWSSVSSVRQVKTNRAAEKSRRSAKALRPSCYR
jgi:hypothetical protein